MSVTEVLGTANKVDFVSAFVGALNVLFSPYFIPNLSLKSIIDTLFGVASLS